MSDEIAIGIDLGTSNSCVSATVAGEPQVLRNSCDEATTASVVAFKNGGEILVGNQAKAQIVLDPPTTVSSAKRLIGRYSFSEEVKKAQAVFAYEIIGDESNSIRIRVRNEEFSLPEISGFVLREMKQIAEAKLGRSVTQAVITVPAYFNDNQRQATKDAGRVAGLEVLRILNEPTAAALAYGYGKDVNERVAVYDLGGGTFDVSVLEIGRDAFEVLATCGDTYLGGDDFDDRLIDLFAEHLQREHSCNVRKDVIAFEKLRAAAEQAKIGLSEAELVQVEIPDLLEVDGEMLSFSYELSRQEFDKLTADLIQRTFKVCDEAMQEAHLTVRDLDGVILVGGPTRLPTVRKSVAEYFQREPEVDINPDEVVALGAAIHAHALVAPPDKAGTTALLYDVVPLSLRLGIAGGQTEAIIDRNAPLPIAATRSFHPARDDQDTVAIKIYQGEASAAEANELLGAFEFTGFELGAREQVQIDVTFEISTEGIVMVAAHDPRTGIQHSTTVSMSSGLSEIELIDIMERGRAEDIVPVDLSPDASAPEIEDVLDEIADEEIAIGYDDALLAELSDTDTEVALEDEPESAFGTVEEDLMLEADAGGPPLELESDED